MPFVHIVLQNEALCFLQVRQPLHTGVRTGVRRWYVCVLVYWPSISPKARYTAQVSPQPRYIRRSEREWANAWDLFRRDPSPLGRGCGDLVVLEACFEGEEIFRDCCFRVFRFERTRPAASMRPPFLIYVSTTATPGCVPSSIM